MNSGHNQLLEQLLQGGNDALANVYKTYRTDFIHWISAHYSCDSEEAKDLYQQCIITFYENVVSGKLTNLTSSVKTYLFSIGKNKLREMNRGKVKEQRLVAEDLRQDDDPVMEILLQKVEACVEKLGEPCRSILIQYYYHKRNIEQLKDLFGYKNTETTKNQKYKCLERLRKMVKDERLTSAI